MLFSFVDVFVESPALMTGVKFDKDTSQFWYKPNISREQGKIKALPCWRRGGEIRGKGEVEAGGEAGSKAGREAEGR